MRRLVLLFATGLGLGYSPFASGTVGTLPGIAIAFAIYSLGWMWQAGICILLTLVSIPLCTRAEKYLGEKDDGRIVADEYMTFPICLIGLPWIEHPWILAVAFVVARILDIVKPAPARQAQDLGGGLGIVVDDFISTLYSLGVCHGIVQLVKFFQS